MDEEKRVTRHTRMTQKRLSREYDGVVFDLFEDTKEADAKVCAVHNQAQKNEADECHLVIAYIIAWQTLGSAEIGIIRSDAGYLVIPRRRGW